MFLLKLSEKLGNINLEGQEMLWRDDLISSGSKVFWSSPLNTGDMFHNRTP